MAIRVKPRPPIQFSIERQSRNAGLMPSRPENTVEPVVVRPDMASKKASVTETPSCSRIGTELAVAPVSQTATVVSRASRG